MRGGAGALKGAGWGGEEGVGGCFLVVGGFAWHLLGSNYPTFGGDGLDLSYPGVRLTS
ncbi:MAG: hypothetical protein GX589_02595 [Deltaproteobacteria bacterium]|nr:hypothetical protein [Deltaproteobacteria bacterium]